MSRTKMNPLVQNACNSEDLLQLFRYHNGQLNEILKSLEQYLNNKRSIFPRFYFLSNDELLAVFAQSREPQMIQVHLMKVFDNVNRLTFVEDQVLRITQFISRSPQSMPEVVPLLNPIEIYPGDKVFSIMKIESFLQKILNEIQATLKEQLFLCLHEFPQDQKLSKFWLLKSFPS